MDFNKVIENRYSVREFTDQIVDSKIIEKIVEVGRIAPSAGNKQPTVVYVLNEEQIKMLKEASNQQVHQVVFKAKHAFLVCYNTKIEMERAHDGSKYGLIDSSIVTTYMMLKITDLGLGSTWIGWFDPDFVKTFFNLPSELIVAAILPFGYIKEDYQPTQRHFERKAMDEFKLALK